MKKSVITPLTALSILLFAACSGIKTEPNPAKLLGRTLKLPENGRWSVMGRDTVMSIPSGVKIVVYYNAEGCRSCRLKQLSNWKELLKDLEKLKKRDSLEAGVVFIVRAASDDKLLIRSLREREFDTPVLCDETGEFERSNVLPEDILYHAFLVNKNNQMLLVGAPIFTPRLWEKYKTKIGGMSHK